MKKIFLLGTCSFIICLNSFGQNNEFKIGVVTWGNSYVSTQNGSILKNKLKPNGEFSSCFGVLSEDGVNITRTYEPTTDVLPGLTVADRPWGRSKKDFRDMLELYHANDMQALIYQEFWAKINSNNLIHFLNEYDLDNKDTYFLNYEQLYNEVLKNMPYRDIVWGANLIGEYNVNSPYPYSGCRPNAWEWIWSSPCFGRGLVPVSNAQLAFSYFDNLYSSLPIKTVNAPGAHNRRFLPYEEMMLNMSARGDVCYEAGYFPRQFDLYHSTRSDNDRIHWKFDNIDYCTERFTEVHTELDVSTFSGNNTSMNMNNENWDYIWFKTYMSIIHGVNGVWFYSPLNTYDNSDQDDLARKNNLLAKDFSRTNFPIKYQMFLSNLIREIAYLKNNGFLNKNSEIKRKTDANNFNGILEPCDTYIPQTLNFQNSRSYFLHHGLSLYKVLNNPHVDDERFGIQYTVRSNGDEIIVILANPNPTILQNIQFDFCSISNPIVQEANGVEMLFYPDNLPPTHPNYKTNRNSGIDLVSNSSGPTHFLPFTNGKKITLSFGPLDIKVIKFKSNVPSYNNGWQKVWSNNGNGQINGWGVKNFDKFYTGDFDGDGAEELFCVQMGSNNKWMTILNYENGDWNWGWSNYGNNHMMLPYRDNFVVGDFDGDGKDELLGNDLGGFTTMFHFNNHSWHWGWSDYGSHSITPYKDNLVVGDFDGDGKDEILGCDLPWGWTTRFVYSNNDFLWSWSDYGRNHSIRPYRNNLISGDFDDDGKDELLGLNSWATMFSFQNHNFLWGWSTYGSNSFSGWTYPIPSNDRILIGDIDGNDTKDEILFLQTGVGASWSTSMDLKNSQNNWNWNWSTYGTVPYLNDWPLANNGGTDTRYLLVKAEANQPEYLLAIRQYGCGNDYLVNMYKSTSRNNKTSSVPELSVSNEAKENGLSIKYNWNIFPNPSRGYITILTSRTDDKSSFDIYDQTGRLVKRVGAITSTETDIDLTGLSSGIYIVLLKTSEGIEKKKIQIIK
jgi:hypothetical protein